MTSYTVYVSVVACYTVDTESKSYDYVLMDDAGNPLPDTAESVQQIEDRTARQIKLEGNGFHFRRQESRVIEVKPTASYSRQPARNTSQSPATPISPPTATNS